MVPIFGFYRNLRDFADVKILEDRLLKFGHKLPFADPTQITAVVLAAWILGEFLSQCCKVLACIDALYQRKCEGFFSNKNVDRICLKLGALGLLLEARQQLCTYLFFAD